MKTILQTTVAECGLACMTMLADAHGHHASLSEMRLRHQVSQKGARLNQLIELGHRLGFVCEALKLEVEDLPKLKTPCILHWDLNHFVVLEKVKGTKAVIHDPAFGKRVMGFEEIGAHFTGIAMEATPGTDFRKKEKAPAVSLRQMTGQVRGIGPLLGKILMLSVVLQVFTLAAPFFMQWVVDQVLVSADRDLLTVLGIGFSLALLLQVATSTLRGWTVVYLSSRLSEQWTSNVFSHLLKLPLTYFEQRHLGDITSRVSSVKSIQRTLTTSFVEVVVDGLLAVAILGLMLVYSVKLALITLAATAIYFAIRAATFRRVRDESEQALIAAARQESHMLESLRGIQSLRVAGREWMRMSTYKGLISTTTGREVRVGHLTLGFANASQLLFGLERVAVIWVGAHLAMQNVFSVGMLVAYLAYKQMFAERASGLVDKWAEFRMLRLHGERLADVVLTETEDTGATHAEPPAITPRIEVQGLSFRYGDAEPWVLKDCSFVVEPGESVALLGASGCGKTTLVKIMLGLLKPTEGTIRYGGHDLKTLGAPTLRSLVGAVMQDDHLFAGSIAENIAFFDGDLDMARVEQAARLASVHDEIAAMPMGYHSHIGDMGSALSGGQKQRIVLARALYRNPQFLFLDEATSHLDVGREQLVNQAVRQLKLTRVMIAHRPDTIASADRALVIDQGRVVQELRPQIVVQHPAVAPPTAA